MLSNAAMALFLRQGKGLALISIESVISLAARKNLQFCGRLGGSPMPQCVDCQRKTFENLLLLV